MEAECGNIYGNTEQSIENHGLRYRSILSDGKIITYSVLNKLNPYGVDHEIYKLDCVNRAYK